MRRRLIQAASLRNPPVSPAPAESRFRLLSNESSASVPRLGQHLICQNRGGHEATVKFEGLAVLRKVEFAQSLHRRNNFRTLRDVLSRDVAGRVVWLRESSCNRRRHNR